jgi:hypothetical protein
VNEETQKKFQEFWDVIANGGSLAGHPDTLKEFFAALSADATISVMNLIGWEAFFGKSKRVIPNEWFERGSLYAIPKLPELKVAPQFEVRFPWPMFSAPRRPFLLYNVTA